MILITGATGTLGSHLLFDLLKTEKTIIALKRTNSNLNKVKKIFSFYTNDVDAFFKRIIWKNADITNYFDVLEAMQNIKMIYHCAAYVSFKNKNKQKYLDTNQLGTANVVNAALQNKVNKLCFVSSIAAIGNNPNGLTTEEDTLNPEQINNYYSLSKYYGEIEVWRGTQEGLNAIIVNPSIIVAPYLLNNFQTKIFKLFAQKGIKHFTCGKKGFVSVYNLVEIMQILMNSDISNERFIISNENLSFKTIISYFNTYFSKPLPTKKLTTQKLNLLRLLNNIFTLGNPTINKCIIHYAINDALYSSNKFLSQINYNFNSIEQTFNTIFNIYKKNF